MPRYIVGAYSMQGDDLGRILDPGEALRQIHLYGPAILKKHAYLFTPGLAPKYLNGMYYPIRTGDVATGFVRQITAIKDHLAAQYRIDQARISAVIRREKESEEAERRRQEQEDPPNRDDGPGEQQQQ